MDLLPFSHNVNIRSRGYLPHWEVDDAIYFITYHLADSLPQHVGENLEREREALVRQIGDDTAVKRAVAQKRYLRRVNACLDDGHGECLLKDPRVAQLVVDGWRQFDGDRYRLLAWCVMPNHAHVVMQRFTGTSLWKTVQSWKGASSRYANEVLGRSGPFWYRDYYDYCVRNERELQRIVDYVLGNPTKIGLTDWPFVGTAG